ncbi:ABC-type glycerol-3-phosphate transport system permease component [Paraburkholderia sp. WSM4179]|nr:ABC-type glycerol-3-phosphate transport system permease component [Paraburkholderia sp. WSM4179]
MFPIPIDKWKPATRRAYKLTLPIALVIWLLPMIAVLVTSVRSTEELSEGNYWGWPKHFAMFDNYREALTTSPMLHYFWNSVLITVPSVVGSIALAAMAGFALAIYRFRGNSTLFATFVAGNFVPIQVLMIPVRDLSLQLGLFNTVSALILFHVSFQTGFCALFSAQLHQAAAIRAGRGGAHRRGERVDRVLQDRAAADSSGARGFGDPRVHVRVERLFLGLVSDARR